MSGKRKGEGTVRECEESGVWDREGGFQEGF